MDAFNLDNVIVEKANAILRYNNLRHITKLFRFGELCFVILFLTWTSTRLPLAVKTSGDYLRQLITFIVSPLFIFVLSNVIVITLLAKSSQSDDTDSDLYEGFISSSVEIGSCFGLDSSNSSVPVPDPVEIVIQDKRMIICELDKSTDNIVKKIENKVEMINETVSEQKPMQRSQSVKLKVESAEKPVGKLRRSETEKCRKIGEKQVDKLSNEEFQRTIEAFIEKQVKFHKEEKLAIVIPTITSSY